VVFLTPGPRSVRFCTKEWLLVSYVPAYAAAADIQQLRDVKVIRIAVLIFSAFLSGLPEGPITLPEGEPPISVFDVAEPKARAERRPTFARRSGLALDPLADLRACSCLRCKIIAVVLEDQHGKHNGKWSTGETFHGLADAAAYFCQEVKDQLGSESGDPVGDLATMVSAKMADRARRLGGADSAIKGTLH
jgi:hypothetical protein